MMIFLFMFLFIYGKGFGILIFYVNFLLLMIWVILDYGNSVVFLLELVFLVCCILICIFKFSKVGLLWY